MGSPKAALDWHGSTLLRRVTGILVRAVPGPVVVVAAPGQQLPKLASTAEVVADARPDRGPLQGLAAGLIAVGGRAGVAYVSSVDVPLLHPAFVRALLASLDGNDDADAAVPEVEGRLQPLGAAYRVTVLGAVEALLSQNRLAMSALLDRCQVRVLAAAELPMPASVTNLNAPADYERALAMPAPYITVNGSAVRAWRLGDVLGGAVAASLNGERVDPDPELPLVSGDVVGF
jgi:molybdenum cofactor guanylyltransferase